MLMFRWIDQSDFRNVWIWNAFGSRSNYLGRIYEMRICLSKFVLFLEKRVTKIGTVGEWNENILFSVKMCVSDRNSTPQYYEQQLSTVRCPSHDGDDGIVLGCWSPNCCIPTYLSMTSSTSILKIGLWYWTTRYSSASYSPAVKFSSNLESEWSPAPGSK